MNQTDPALRVRGAKWLDTAHGDVSQSDFLIADGVIQTDDGREAITIDGSGMTAMFGLWDCHGHGGDLMYDPTSEGFFEGLADRTIRAGENFTSAVEMSITGVRSLAAAEELDIAWGRAFSAGTSRGPRIHGAGRGIRTTGGHGTGYPRIPTRLRDLHVVDGPDAMARAVRSQVERGAQWIKIMLTGGLQSPHETADGAQFTAAELATVMEVANLRGIPVAAHCGGTAPAIAFSDLGGRSVEHGYMLEEEAAAVMARNGTWLVPTIGVTHDQDFIADEGWPAYAADRAREIMSHHADGLRACIEAGVKIAVGADLNPIGERFHRELELLETVGMDRRAVLHAASVGGRELNGFGPGSTPDAGAAADIVLLDQNPMDSLETLRDPVMVVTHGRVVYERQS